MRPKTTAILAVALALGGAASGLALRQGGVVIIGGGTSDDRRAGPDSARVEAFLTALRSADPMVCEMVSDQVGNFWSSHGDYGVGLLAGSSRSWESARDSLYGPATGAALRRLGRALDDESPCV